MQFYRFWTKADRSSDNSKFSITCYGHSNESLDDAFRVAQQRAAAAVTSLASGQFRDNQYYGNERPFREEIVEEFTSTSGETTAIISRNSYGSLILNTPDVFFADVDLPHQESKSTFSIFGLFGKSEQEPSFERRLVEKIGIVCQADSSIGIRLYRTAKGFRIIITSRTIPTHEANSNRLLEALGSDKLYVSLCKTQDCYRARLTPKPWRCDCPGPPTRFPFSSPQDEQWFRSWEKEYDQAIPAYATCMLIGDFGSSYRDPAVEKIIQLHDHFTIDGEKPLA